MSIIISHQEEKLLLLLTLKKRRPKIFIQLFNGDLKISFDNRIRLTKIDAYKFENTDYSKHIVGYNPFDTDDLHEQIAITYCNHD